MHTAINFIAELPWDTHIAVFIEEMPDEIAKSFLDKFLMFTSAKVALPTACKLCLFSVMYRALEHLNLGYSHRQTDTHTLQMKSVHKHDKPVTHKYKIILFLIVCITSSGKYIYIYIYNARKSHFMLSDWFCK